VLIKELKAKATSAKSLAKNQTKQRLVSQKTITKTSLSLAKTTVLSNTTITTR
jgi:hypothetical protein